MRVVIVVLCLLLIVIGAVLGYANHAPVGFDLLIVQVEWPLIALMFIAFALGVMVTAVIYGFRQWRVGRRAVKAEKRLRAVESELRHLRQIASPTKAASGLAPADRVSTAAP